MSGQELDRDELIEQCAALGYGVRDLTTMPTYYLQKLLEIDCDNGAHDADEDNDDDDNELSFFPNAAPVQQPKSRPVDDDVQTVVDLSFMEDAAGAAKRKYKKYQLLTRPYEQQLSAIQNNQAVFQKRQKVLDPDDRYIVERAILKDQKNLKQIMKEIVSIQQWFHQHSQNKEDMYSELSREFLDSSGQLKYHFKKKRDELRQISSAMQEYCQSRFNVRS
jgi:hypothetical protein